MKQKLNGGTLFAKKEPKKNYGKDRISGMIVEEMPVKLFALYKLYSLVILSIKTNKMRRECSKNYTQQRRRIFN